MLSASKANALANERIGTMVKGFVDEAEKAILARCDEGCKCATLTFAWSADEKWAVRNELVCAGYEVRLRRPNGLVVRW